MITETSLHVSPLLRGMNSLPAELIAFIFELGQAQHARESNAHNASLKYLLILCSIGKRWRNIALSTPKLWSTIYARARPDIDPDNELMLTRLEAQLLRSASAPLHLTIDFFFVHRPEDVWGLLSPHLPRCRSLTLLEVYMSVSHHIFPLPPSEKLAELSINASPSVDSVSVVDVADGFPNLSSMTLIGFNLTRIPDVRVDKLCISSADAPSGEPHTLLPILSLLDDWTGSQFLQHLQLRGLRRGELPPPDPSKLHALPRLTSLEIGDIPFDDYVFAPLLKTLQWEDVARHGPQIPVKASGIETLIVDNSFPHGPLEAGPLDALKRLVLRRVDNTRWFGLLSESILRSAGSSASPKHAPNLQTLELPDAKNPLPQHSFTDVCRLLDLRPRLNVKMPVKALRFCARWGTGKYGGRLSAL